MHPSLFSLPSDWKTTPVQFLPHWGEAKRIGIDIETYDPNLKTTGPSVRTGGFIAGVGFAIEDGPTHYLPIRHEGGGNLPADEVLRYLRTEARKFPGILVGANLNYDLDFLAEEGITFPNIKQQRDVQIADPLIDELQQSYSLDAIAKRHGLPGKDEAQLRLAAAHYGIKDVKADLWRLPGEHVGPYGGFDAELPLRVLRRQERIIDDQDLWRIFDLECALQPVLLKMTRWGVCIDQDQLARVEDWALNEEAKFLAEITRSTGCRLAADDVNKKAALIRVLEAAGVELTERTESGQIRLDAAVLNSLEHPAADLIRRARKVNKLRTTFAASIRRHMVGGRIHCSFHQLRATHKMGDEKGARFGRISCSDPNLQQQPSRDAFAPMWRSIYVPDNPEDLWISADFSQQEPRMTTHYAEAMRLPRASEAAEEYRTNPKADNHDMMTRLIHPEAINWDTKSAEFQKIRKVAKGIYLGLCIARGTRVVTDRGTMPIENVCAHDKLWDGNEFVQHGGVVAVGVKQCIEVNGNWMTPSHEVLTPHGWFQAQDLSMLNLNPEQLTDSLQLSRLSLDQGAASSPSSVVAPVVDALLHCETIWSAENRHAVLSVVKQRLLRHVHNTRGIQHIANDFLTEFVASLGVALRVRSRDTVDAEFGSTLLGSLTEQCFSNTCSRFPDMMTRILKLIGSTTTGTTNLATFGSSRMPKTCATEAFDVLDAGPHNRFCLGNGMIVSNCYGMGGAKLAEMLGLPTKEIATSRGHQITVAGDEAQAMLDRFDARVPYVRGLARLVEVRAQQQGYITTILGRRMRFPKKAGGGYDWTYKALNRLIQGSSGDQIKQVMVDLDGAGLLPQLQIHDEVCRGGDMETARRIKEIMEGSLPLRVPSRVDVEVGPSWGQCKVVENV